MRPFVAAVTGASGALYAARLLEVLASGQRPLHVVFSPAALAVIRQELGLEYHPLKEGILPLIRAGQKWWPERAFKPGQALDHAQVHAPGDLMAPIASGSFLTEAMVICPCSGGTLSALVHSSSGNLIQRAAEVHLKERRKLVLVPREMPLSTPQLENMLKASQYGAIVAPAAPGFYHGAKELPDLIDFVVARICDQLGVEHSLMQRWGRNEQK